MTDLKWSRFNFLVETEKHRKYLNRRGKKT